MTIDVLYDLIANDCNSVYSVSITMIDVEHLLLHQTQWIMAWEHTPLHEDISNHFAPVSLYMFLPPQQSSYILWYCNSLNSAVMGK